jgi:very-short-patch-repair endonuclease
MQRTPPELTSNARELRFNATDAERVLWQHLRQLRPRFTRQLVVSHFILDFACRTLKLAIELDGGQHASRTDADIARTAYLEAQGWSVLRFWNNDVLANTDGVMETILAIVSRASTPPSPSLSGRGARNPFQNRISPVTVARLFLIVEAHAPPDGVRESTKHSTNQLNVPTHV